MGVYLNPGNKAYQELLDSPIVVDKSLLIEKVANRHNVIHLNMQKFLSAAQNMDDMLCRIRRKLIRELQRDYPEHCCDTDLSSVLEEIFAYAKASFVFIVDEWDCVFREYKTDKEAQKNTWTSCDCFLKINPM